MCENNYSLEEIPLLAHGGSLRREILEPVWRGQTEKWYLGLLKSQIPTFSVITILDMLVEYFWAILLEPISKF